MPSAALPAASGLGLNGVREREQSAGTLQRDSGGHRRDDEQRSGNYPDRERWGSVRDSVDTVGRARLIKEAGG